MTKNTTKLAVVPARAGSTRLKDKNIYLLAGKPLIRWSVEAIVKSECYDKILISTDSDAIFDAVADLPVERHKRTCNCKSYCIKCYVKSYGKI